LHHVIDVCVLLYQSRLIGRLTKLCGICGLVFSIKLPSIISDTFNYLSTTMTPPQKLFQPIRIGANELSHRAALAPLTRCRATDDHVPTDLMREYYEQRSSTPGTLLITEATPVAKKAGGMRNIPGIWNQAQIDGWKKVRGQASSSVRCT
jgi:hypothetical protein